MRPSSAQSVESVMAVFEGGPTHCRTKGRCHTNAYLDKLLDGLCDVGVKLFDLYGGKVHVAQQAVDDLEERLLHAG